MVSFDNVTARVVLLRRLVLIGEQVKCLSSQLLSCGSALSLHSWFRDLRFLRDKISKPLTFPLLQYLVDQREFAGLQDKNALLEELKGIHDDMNRLNRELWTLVRTRMDELNTIRSLSTDDVDLDSSVWLSQIQSFYNHSPQVKPAKLPSQVESTSLVSLIARNTKTPKVNFGMLHSSLLCCTALLDWMVDMDVVNKQNEEHLELLSFRFGQLAWLLSSDTQSRYFVQFLCAQILQIVEELKADKLPPECQLSFNDLKKVYLDSCFRKFRNLIDHGDSFLDFQRDELSRVFTSEDFQLCTVVISMLVNMRPILYRIYAAASSAISPSSAFSSSASSSSPFSSSASSSSSNFKRVSIQEVYSTISLACGGNMKRRVLMALFGLEKPKRFAILCQWHEMKVIPSNFEVFLHDLEWQRLITARYGICDDSNKTLDSTFCICCIGVFPGIEGSIVPNGNSSDFCFSIKNEKGRSDYMVRIV